MSVMGATVLAIVIAVIVIVVAWILFWWLYRRASKETAFVRTGLGGQRVVVNGGALVIPVLHEITSINMNTIRLEVVRAREHALIAKDRIRVDVAAEFYVRVGSAPEAVALAARTLGGRTMRPDALRELLEGRLVDPLRAVAAEHTIEELHEHRGDFIQRVKGLLDEALGRSGLELEAASLTGLDQTDRDFFNPGNAFDAAGLTKLTGEIEERRRRRNEIEQEAEVAIQLKNLEAEKRKLEIAREEEYARLEQEREIAVRRAEERAQIAREESGKRRDSEEAEIASRREIDVARVTAEQELDTRRIEAERAVEQERLRKDREVQQSAIESELSVDLARIDQQRALAIAEQQRVIAVAEHSREETRATAEASAEKVQAVAAEEDLITQRDSLRHEREKMLELIEARKNAEKSAVATLVAAETERKEAEERAAAARIRTESEAARTRSIAEAEADAETVLAHAAKLRSEIESAAQRAMNEADNLLSGEQVEMKVKLAIVDRLQEIIRESVRPMERIEGIKILQVDGLGSGAGGTPAGPAGTPNDNLAEQVVASALRYRAQAPILDALLNELGLASTDPGGLTALVRKQVEAGTGNDGNEDTDGAAV